MGLNYRKHAFDPSIKEQLIELRKLDNWHCIVAVLYDYFVIAISIALSFISPWFYPITLLLIGSRQRALATVLHEAVHCCIAKSRKLNHFVGTFLSGYLIFQEYNTYRDTHVKQHHAYLGDPSKDPDYHYHLSEQIYMPRSGKAFLKRYILKPALLIKTGSYFWYMLKNRMKPSKKYLNSFLVMYTYWAVILGASYFFNILHYVVLFWLIPIVTTSAIIGWFNELSEHYPLVGKYNTDIHMTRNRFSHWLEHFIFNTHEENYHLIHHLYATIPFWNLKKAHEVLCQDPEYNRLNKKMGGIFWSNNDNPSLVQQLVSTPAINTDGTIQYEY